MELAAPVGLHLCHIMTGHGLNAAAIFAARLQSIERLLCAEMAGQSDIAKHMAADRMDTEKWLAVPACLDPDQRLAFNRSSEIKTAHAAELVSINSGIDVLEALLSNI